MAATTGSLFNQDGKIWANGYDSPTLEAGCPGRDMELCCHIHDPQNP